MIGTFYRKSAPDKDIFTDSEIILSLHDDYNGTLFKMPSW